LCVILQRSAIDQSGGARLINAEGPQRMGVPLGVRKI
jgi:hypothetical protein